MCNSCSDSSSSLTTTIHRRSLAPSLKYPGHHLTWHPPLHSSPFQPSSPPFHSPKILPLDLSDATSIAGRAQEAVEAFGHVDLLVNNAGMSSRSSVMETDTAVDRRVMEVNFFGTVALTKGGQMVEWEVGRWRDEGHTYVRVFTVESYW